MALIDPRNNEYDVSKLQSSSIIGHVTPTTAKIWIRTYKAGSWSLVWSESKLPTSTISSSNLPLSELIKLKILPSGSKHQDYIFTDETDLTTTFNIDSLKPGTKYYYYLIATDHNPNIDRNIEIGYHKELSFTTTQEVMTDFSFGFYSCHDPYNANGSYGAWPLFLERLNNAKASFVIGGGDQVYVDCQESKFFPDIWEWLKKNKDDLLAKYTVNGVIDSKGLDSYLLDLYRWYYRVYWKFPHMQEAFSRLPQYMIWDDHEIMDGWGSRTKEERLKILSRYFRGNNSDADQTLIDSMWKAARTAYFEYAHSHNPSTNVDRALLATSEKCQWDYSFNKGDIPFYVLDLRGHHDVERPKNRLLGDEQLDRFLSWLTAQQKSKSQVIFVVSPVPFVHWRSAILTIGSMTKSAKDDCFDEWDHTSNHKERDLVLEAMFKSLAAKGKTLVILSGDVHCAAAFRLHHDKYKSGNLFQITSSAISRMPAGQISSIGIANSGQLTNNKKIYLEHVFSHTEDKNFAIIHIANGTSISVDLGWPGGTEGESVIKTIHLTKQ